MNPAEASLRFAEMVTAGDVAAALECWTEDAVMAAPDGSVASGRADLAARLEQLVNAGTAMTIRIADLVTAGDVAMATTESTLAIGDDEPARLIATVVYRHEDGRWRIAIDRVDAASS